MDKSLALASRDRLWSLLIRHAERPEIPAGTFGDTVSITETGRKSAEGLGRVLGPRLRRLVTSPVLRCVQTAEAIRDGAGVREKLILDRVLGDPGVWISDGKAVGGLFLELGAQGLVALQIAGHSIPGITPLDEGVARFIELLGSGPLEAGAIDVYVSHDAVIAPLLSALIRERDLPKVWPSFLEAALLSRTLSGVDVIWRGHRHCVKRS